MHWQNIKRIVIGTAAALILVSMALAAYSAETNRRLSDSLIRLHIVGESNDAEDQRVKLAVRDAVLAWIDNKSKTEDFADRDSANRFILDNKQDIKEVALQALRVNGSDSDVAVDTGMVEFPTKTYGGVTLPAGDYYALKLTLGSGSGANWWCVLFPPLCFADLPGSSQKVADSLGAGSELSRLTDNSPSKPAEYKFKFKIVEMFQSIRQKLFK